MADPITITGNIATEPTRQTTNAGTPFTKFRVASSNRRRDPKTGEWSDLEPNWYTVYAYRALAENAVASLSKGQRIVAAGTLKVREWERDERSGTVVEVVAQALGADLRYGRSTFTKSERAGGQAPNGAQPTQESAGESADAWAAPGDEAWPVAEIPLGADDETPI